METNKEQVLASLVRVRNRLALAPNVKLPRILVGLLPRLLKRLDTNTQALLRSDCCDLENEIQQQLTGILSHAYERIRSESYQPAPWIVSLSETLVTLQTAVSKTMAVSLLKVGLENSQPKDEEIIAPLITFLERQAETAALYSSSSSAEASTSSDQKLVQSAGWLLIDAIALASGLPTKEEDVVGSQHHQPWPDLERIPSLAFSCLPANQSGGGVLDIFLDILLYWPTIQARFGLEGGDNSTGLSHQGLSRMDTKRTLFLENDIYLRQLKYVCTAFALGPEPGKGLLRDDQATLLAVLASADKSRHGRFALSWLDRYLMEQTDTSERCSLCLSISLMILMISDDAASHLTKGQNQKSMGFVRPLPANPSCFRSALPHGVAARAMEFLDSHFSISPRQVLSEGDNIALILDLAVGLQKDGNSGDYWGVQIMHRIYLSVNVVAAPQTSNTSFVDTRSVFLGKCLMVAEEALKKLLHVNHYEEQQIRPDPHEDLPLGAVRPIGQREGINHLLADHRRRQRKKQLCCHEAMDARRIAYELIADLSSQSYFDMDDMDAPKFVLPSLLLECVAVEEACLLEFANRALKTQLDMYISQMSMITGQSKVNQVARFLPAVLSAACTDSNVARLAAATWSVHLLSKMDPEAAQHICNFLLQDDDMDVVGVAKSLPNSNAIQKPVKDAPLTLFDQSDEKDRSVLCSMLDGDVQILSQEASIPTDVASLLLFDCSFDLEGARRFVQIRRSELSVGYGNEGTLLNQVDFDGAGLCSECCSICYENATEMYRKKCGHMFCRSCWEAYLKSSFDMPGGCLGATCPHHDCTERILRGDFAHLCPQLLSYWNSALVTAYLELSECFVYCPGPDCRTVAYNPYVRRVSATCRKCATVFCARCGRAPHVPCRCESWKKWNAIFGSSSFWIKKNSKPCPSCNVATEKADGCNHMSCSRCGAQYCWLCLAPLRSHLEAHTCNRFDPLTRAENAQEARALFFTERFRIHEESEVYTKKKLNTLDHTANRASRNVHFRAQENEIGIHKRVASLLVSVRNFLKLSYVEAWALGENDEKRASFENHQATLELVTERLSLLFHENVDKLHHNEGAFGTRLHYRTMSFLASCADRYRLRIVSLLEEKAKFPGDQLSERLNDGGKIKK